MLTPKLLPGWEAQLLGRVIAMNGAAGGCMLIFFGLPAALLGAGLLVLGLMGEPMGVVCALPTGGGGVLMLAYYAFVWLAGPSFYRVLRDRPRDVVWVYQERNRFSQGGQTTVVLGLSSREKVSFEVQQDAVAQVFWSLNQSAPWATFGHTLQARDAFDRNPNALRRA